MKTFDDIKLSKALLNALREQNITEPTRIQRKAIPSILSGNDVVGIAQTGTGKTIAYLLPVLRDLKFSDQRPPRVLILVPTRELVVQVVSEIEKLSAYMTVRTLGIYGGTNINTQKQAIHEGCDIVVATPGRLYDLAMTGLLRLKEVKKLIIDECDEMLDLGFRPQIMRIFELLPPKCQNLLFSATITSDVDELITTFFKKTERIIAAPSGTPISKIKQSAYLAPNFFTKLSLLKKLLEEGEDMEKIFIFVKSRAIADRLISQLDEIFPETFGVIHSNKSQNYRLRMVREFKEGALRGLVATDIVSRGIDIENVSHVINFDIPDQPEQYMHRIGRTGRAEQDGIAVSFISEAERDDFSAIENFMGISVETNNLPDEIEVSKKLIPEEEEPDLHDAPTILQANHSVGEGMKFEKSKKQPKKENIRPRDKAKRKSRKRRKK
ncbi:MAG: DEAD/DEAH box helicase [Brumimicrobium sp.]|nr:DEAD/DEAH box helicase [Brumimicrobium sp.]